MVNAGVTVGGMTASDLFTAHMNPQTKRTWRRKIAESHLSIVEFNWTEKLPENGPPPLINA